VPKTPRGEASLRLQSTWMSLGTGWSLWVALVASTIWATWVTCALQCPSWGPGPGSAPCGSVRRFQKRLCHLYFSRKMTSWARPKKHSKMLLGLESIWVRGTSLGNDTSDWVGIIVCQETIPNGCTPGSSPRRSAFRWPGSASCTQPENAPGLEIVPPPSPAGARKLL